MPITYINHHPIIHISYMLYIIIIYTIPIPCHYPLYHCEHPITTEPTSSIVSTIEAQLAEPHLAVPWICLNERTLEVQNGG